MRPSRISPLSGRALSQQALTTGALIGCGTQANVDTSGGAVTLLAPSVLYPSAEVSAFMVWDSSGNADANAITIDGNGRLIDGETDVELSSPGATYLFLLDQDSNEWRMAIVPRADPNVAERFFLKKDLLGLVPGGGGAPAYYEIDASDQLVYRFQGSPASSTVQNLGALGAGMNLSLSGGGIGLSNGVQGVGDNHFGKGYAAALQSNIGYVGRSPAHNPGWTSVSMAVWITLNRYLGAANFGRVFYKNANAGSWSNPYSNFCLQFESANGGLAGIVQNMVPQSFSAALNVPAAREALAPMLHRPSHLGMTYSDTDGVIRLYVNGVNVASANPPGGWSGINLGTGEWQFGDTWSANIENVGGIYHEVRVANVRRSADWFQEVYRAGMGLG